MQQYFIDQSVQVSDHIVMDSEQSHHMIHVLRMKSKDIIRIADIQHHMYHAAIRIEAGVVYATILDEIMDHTKSNVHITLAQGLIKKEKWDFLLQKSAELGVDVLLPFISSRTVVKYKEEKADKKRQRYEKILLEACEQCKRSTLVEFKDTIPFAKLIEQEADLKLIAYEDADDHSERLQTVLHEYSAAKRMIIVIGSEGGFHPDEVKLLEAHGYQRVSLGARILRAETAAMYVLSALAFFYGDREGERA